MGIFTSRKSNRTNNDELNSILSVSIILIAGRMGGVAANFFFTLLLARLLPPEDVGIIMVIISTAMLASILTTLNIEAGSIQHLLHAREQGENEKAAGFVLFVRRLWLVATPIVVVGYLVVAYALNPEKIDGFFWVYLAGAVSIPIIGWLRLNTRQAIVLSHQLAGSLPNLFLRPVLLLALLGLGFLAGIVLTPEIVLGLFAFTALLAALVQFYYLRDVFKFVRTNPHSFAFKNEWLKTGFLLTGSLIIVVFFQDITLVAAAIVLPPAESAKLAITLRLVGFLSFGIAAVNVAIGPKIATALAQKDFSTRDSLLTTSTHLKLWPGMVIALLIILFGEYILLIFGPAYVEAAPALNWLLLIPLAMAVLGPNETLLNASGLQRYIFTSAFIAVAIAVVSIPLAGEAYGLIGAAAAAACSFCIWEVLIYLFVRWRLGIDASLLGVINRTWKKQIQERIAS